MNKVIDKLIQLDGIDAFQYNVKANSYTIYFDPQLTVRRVKEIVRSLKEMTSEFEIKSILGDSGVELLLTENANKPQLYELN